MMGSSSAMGATATMPMQTPQDLFVHELSDILSGEQIIVRMLEQAQGMVQTEELREGLRMHQEQSLQQAERVQQVIRMVGQEPHPVTCHAAEGLMASLMEVVQSNPSPEVLEGAVVAGACKTEHLEIAGYTGLVEKAKAMGMSEAEDLLKQNLQEEEAMLKQVEKIAKKLTKQMASTAA